ncbi:acyltransferase family protein [Pseudonocardia sp. TRM90224]|uniref:acyltransferase family protein n=1 Tax=Pseudonocardia sp. TRM90224 TaxID=2812678 RepID=UPI001E537CDB|nr:acyltransferase family protein [Pseudonocardia sp. TRM90224]
MTRPEGKQPASVEIAAPRLFYVDNLRVALTVLVVLHHVAVTYGNIPVWYYVETAQDESGLLLDLLVVLNQTFFMGFFFMVSGFFVPASYDRKGQGRFVKDRLFRLGVPLLLFALLIRPLLTIPSAIESGLPYWQYYIASWDPGPLWFVEVLLVFTLVYAAFRGRRPAPAPITEPKAPGLLAIAGFVLVLAAVTYAWRFVFPSGTYIPYLGLPSVSYMPQYVGLFAVGVVAHRKGWFAALPRKAAPIALTVAPVATVVLLPFSGMLSGDVSSPLIPLWEAIFAVSMAIGLTVLFRERFNKQGRLGRFLSRNAFAVYVLHPIVLVSISYALIGLHTLAAVKFLVVAVIAVPACWALAAAVRAIPGAKQIL